MIPVVYSEQMVAKNSSFSPSAEKPMAVMEDWLRQGFPLEILPPEPVSPEQFSLAHDPEYVRRVLELLSPNGFGNYSKEVAASLPYTTGSLLGAARTALKSRRVACSPSSGFHHARYSGGAGYCTFNGLMVTAMVLRNERLASRIAILDCDQHHGDGTENIIEIVGARDWIYHYSCGALFGRVEQAEYFPLMLERVLEGMKDYDILLYQAGADPHINDPLGGWLTTEQLYERDRLVFSLAQKYELPIVWDLAGGYRRDGAGSIEPVVETHRNTMWACYEVYEEIDVP